MIQLRSTAEVKADIEKSGKEYSTDPASRYAFMTGRWEANYSMLLHDAQWLKNELETLKQESEAREC